MVEVYSQLRVLSGVNHQRTPPEHFRGTRNGYLNEQFQTIEAPVITPHSAVTLRHTQTLMGCGAGCGAGSRNQANREALYFGETGEAKVWFGLAVPVAAGGAESGAATGEVGGREGRAEGPKWE
jgi:hypothetical protein